MVSNNFASAVIVSLLAAITDGSPYHAASSTAFAFSTTRSKYQQPSSLIRMPTSTTTKLHMALPSKAKSSTVAEIEAESELLRKEIEVLRKEALQRLDDLNAKLTSSSSKASSSSSSESTTVAKNPDATSSTTTTTEELLPAPAPIVFTETKDKSSSTKKKSMKSMANLLDETRWKVSLSIGREPGTWMPAEWGKSGQRLNLSFTAEFTPSQLFDRDDFLRGGYSNSKILHVLNNEIKLGPSITEGERRYKVKDGGWQVSRGEGPMGTDLLRFYVEVDEQIAHSGGDVYVPRGRVYSSCGYFPFGDDAVSSVKERFAKELKEIVNEMADLQEKKDEIKNPFNLDGIKISREIYRLNREAEKVNGKLNFAMVKEPDKGLLRFSKDGDVGLTKEGGVCCQVSKGVVMEYHILGRFSISSANRD
mmetsp:Transcript_13757/g.24923  ORF Transcript_13757/g.24923 Transcript_13757/m.24923 type:complete len:421 (-) Transcript_13757:1051-2313(-)|eukprot:CAMPEP_0201674900 /NCGR_PEP_ID=MMETSP0494-20130426/38269_1 /ASSEMBLY_ACC=CAM_ASM_000839 /TAXON_ID=420259 /ORGANISM="Thalassiosira gravida, Strain GMp14c1" /LENGTH=420 /DNA_ID=CAMNT_0048157167 /DNA_START=194 /DNA_END=1456 /DNA_ORIENTATION=-